MNVKNQCTRRAAGWVVCAVICGAWKAASCNARCNASQELHFAGGRQGHAAPRRLINYMQARLPQCPLHLPAVYVVPTYEPFNQPVPNTLWWKVEGNWRG